MFNIDKMIEEEVNKTITLLESKKINRDIWNRAFLLFRSLLKERYLELNYIYFAKLLINQAVRLKIEDVYLVRLGSNILEAKKNGLNDNEINMIFLALVRDLDKDYICELVRKKL